jgi:hypothetical protein
VHVNVLIDNKPSVNTGAAFPTGGLGGRLERHLEGERKTMRPKRKKKKKRIFVSANRSIPIRNIWERETSPVELHFSEAIVKGRVI